MSDSRVTKPKEDARPGQPLARELTEALEPGPVEPDLDRDDVGTGDSEIGPGWVPV